MNNAQTYLTNRLAQLGQPLGIAKPKNDTELGDTIFRIIMSKRYRKYAAGPELTEHIKDAIALNIKQGTPINATYVHGAYKLWRLNEAPEPDWAELFAMMYYTNWLRPICEIYEPGVWFDNFVDDYIVPILNNISAEDVDTYLTRYRGIFAFLKQYQPANFKMTATGVGEQFASREAFQAQLDDDVAEYAKQLPNGLPDVAERRKTMIDLNARPTEAQQADPDWYAKNTLIHDAYISMTKRNTGYHGQPTKILTFNQPLPSGTALALGTTRSSVAKFWAGVGVLKPKGDEYGQLILSPSQLEHATFHTEALLLEGLEGKNFHQIRVLAN